MHSLHATIQNSENTLYVVVDSELLERIPPDDRFQVGSVVYAKGSVVYRAIVDYIPFGEPQPAETTDARPKLEMPENKDVISVSTEPAKPESPPKRKGGRPRGKKQSF